MRRTFVFASIILPVLTFSAFGQESSDVPFRQQAFPAWMNETSESSSNAEENTTSHNNITEPIEPIDPDGKNETSSSRSPAPQATFKFTPPKMPDFSKIRAKSVSVTKTASGTGIVETSISASSSEILASSATTLASISSNHPSKAHQAGEDEKAHKATIPARFYRPSNYSSFFKESLHTSSESAEDASLTFQSTDAADTEQEKNK